MLDGLRYFSEDDVSIGAECPKCERVLKIYKNQLSESNDGFIIKNGVSCICKEIFTNIHKKPKSVHCPRCYSENISAHKKGYGLGKAVAGGVLLGPIGLLGGFLGSRKVLVTCLKCGHQWTPVADPTTHSSPESTKSVHGPAPEASVIDADRYNLRILAVESQSATKMLVARLARYFRGKAPAEIDRQLTALPIIIPTKLSKDTAYAVQRKWRDMGITLEVVPTVGGPGDTTRH
jgi:hypothetical protein